MERPPQCPVCTLYLREGITLERHLDTHPKDQVIKALCALSIARPSSRSSSRASSGSSSRPSSRSLAAAPPRPLPPPSPDGDYGEGLRTGSSANGPFCGPGCGCGVCFDSAFRAAPARFARPPSFLADPPSPTSRPPRYASPATPVGFVVSPSSNDAIAKGDILIAPLPVGRFPVSRVPSSFAPSPRIFVDAASRSVAPFNDFVLLGSYPAVPRLATPAAVPSAERGRGSGLRILSDVKLNDSAVGRIASAEIIDLTLGRGGRPSRIEESILPDLNDARSSGRPEDDSRETSKDGGEDAEASTSSADSGANAFSVIKNSVIKNPTAAGGAKTPEGELSEDAYIVPETTPPERISAPGDADVGERTGRSPAKSILSMEISSLISKLPAKRNARSHRPKRAPPIENLEDEIKSERSESGPPPVVSNGGPAAIAFDFRSTIEKMDVDEDEYRDPIGEDASSIKTDVDDKGDFFFAVENSSAADESKRDSAISVNVIAFGNKTEPNEGAETAALSDPPESADENDKETNDNSSSSSFDGPKSDIPPSEIREFGSDPRESEARQREEPRRAEDRPPRSDDLFLEEEIAIAPFVGYERKPCEKIEERADRDERGNDSNKNYTELLCPRNDFFEVDKSSFFDSIDGDAVANASALNIQTDETMPPRGELSEQDSSGDADAPWAGVYRDSAAYSDVVGSTSYDLLARETWPSDGSDIETPPDPYRNSTNMDDNRNSPVLVSVKPSEKKYKCATCGESFDCPKERRVHRTKEHSVGSGEKRAIKKNYLPISSIKKEKMETEPVPLPAASTAETIDSKIAIEDLKKDDVNIEFVNCSSVKSEENKPNISLLGVEPERKKPDFVCATCKVEFPNLSEYNLHLKIHPLECLTCGKLFNRRPNLLLHLKRHYGIKDYKCGICDKRFITKQKMMEHYNIHTGKAPIKCNMCDLYFRRHSNMVQHRNRYHLNIKKKVRDYVCSCGEVFQSKKKLAWHREIHDEKPKACLHCNEKFVHMSSLTRHIRRAHNNYFVPDEKRKNENVECPECNNVYLKSSIEMHMKTHTGAKPFSCVICNKSFTTKWNLKLHKWTHANRSSKPFKCNLCKGAFVRQSDYVSHMNAHKSVRPYTCNYCGCQFIRKYNCQRHVREHEGEKKYVCEVPDCGKAFHRSYYLTEHLTVHSGVRPYTCNICGKTSSTKSNHNKHVKIHHAREPITTEG